MSVSHGGLTDFQDPNGTAGVECFASTEAEAEVSSVHLSMLQTDVSVLGPNFLVDPLLVQSLSLDGVCSPAESQQQLILKPSLSSRGRRWLLGNRI